MKSLSIMTDMDLDDVGLLRRRLQRMHATASRFDGPMPASNSALMNEHAVGTIKTRIVRDSLKLVVEGERDIGKVELEMPLPYGWSADRTPDVSDFLAAVELWITAAEAPAITMAGRFDMKRTGIQELMDEISAVLHSQGMHVAPSSAPLYVVPLLHYDMAKVEGDGSSPMNGHLPPQIGDKPLLAAGLTARILDSHRAVRLTDGGNRPGCYRMSHSGKIRGRLRTVDPLTTLRTVNRLGVEDFARPVLAAAAKHCTATG